MASDGIIDAGTGIVQIIGRYFSVISIIPSALYIAFIYLLVISGSWQHAPDWSHAFTSLEKTGFSGLAILVFLSIALGMIIHPTQFALVQFFEGYWGNNRFAQAIRSERIKRYQLLCQGLSQKKAAALAEVEALHNSGTAKALDRTSALSRFGEADRIRETFPRALDHIMPTRLGNVLRRVEAQAGSQYSLEALQVVPHILLVAPASHVEYVSDQRSQLDLAVRMTFMSGLASATALLFLWHRHYWIFIAVIPYLVAYLSYRGSVIAAGHYAAALEVLINIDRFEMYKQLRLRLPSGTSEERRTNKDLTELLNYDPFTVIQYQHPEDLPGQYTLDHEGKVLSPR